jgi:hypothetical protein
MAGICAAYIFLLKKGTREETGEEGRLDQWRNVVWRKLLGDLKLKEWAGFRNSVRMTPSNFEMLLQIRGLSKKFVQYVYKNFILQILGYINVVPFKILPIWHNTLVPPLFPLLEAPLEFRFS